MSYIDIEQELDKITGNLKQDLLKAGAINITGKVINKETFNRVIDEKIDECSAMSAKMEASGKRFDANSANIIGARIDFLRTIQNAGTLQPHMEQTQSYEKEIIKKAEARQKTNGFLDGIKKLFRKNPTPSQSRSK